MNTDKEWERILNNPENMIASPELYDRLGLDDNRSMEIKIFWNEDFIEGKVLRWENQVNHNQEASRIRIMASIDGGFSPSMKFLKQQPTSIKMKNMGQDSIININNSFTSFDFDPNGCLLSIDFQEYDQ